MCILWHPGIVDVFFHAWLIALIFSSTNKSLLAKLIEYEISL